MDGQKFILAGKIIKVHGYKGDLLLKPEPEYFDDIVGAKTVFLEIEGLLAPFFISDGNVRLKDSNSLFIKFDDINSETDANEFIGAGVYISGKLTGKSEKNETFQQYISYIIEDKSQGVLGKLEGIMNISSNPVLQVRTERKEILIPAHKSFILSVDNITKRIIVDLPDGLIEINA